MFSVKTTSLFPDYNIIEYRIDLESNSQLLYGLIYILLKKELEILYEYLDTNIVKN